MKDLISFIYILFLTSSDSSSEGDTSGSVTKFAEDAEDEDEEAELLLPLEKNEGKYLAFFTVDCSRSDKSSGYLRFFTGLALFSDSD